MAIMIQKSHLRSIYLKKGEKVPGYFCVKLVLSFRFISDF